MRYTLVALSSLLTTLYALTITSPTSGSTVDPSQPITITWTSTSSDPSTINLFAVQGGNNNQVATNVPTSAGTYTVPPNTILSYGAGYSIAARSTAGDDLASTGSFILAYGATVATKVNGQLSLVATTASAAVSTPSDQSATATDATASVTGTDSSSSTITGLPFTTHGPQSFSTTLSDTASSMTGSATSSAASSTASATHNAQPRIGAGKEVIGFAGLLAGLVAIVA